jgi:hypothetical protein
VTTVGQYLGGVLGLVAARLSQGRLSARPSIGGMAAAVPVDRTTARRAISSRYPSTATRRSPVSRPVPRISVMPLSANQGSWPSSRQPLVM